MSLPRAIAAISAPSILLLFALMVIASQLHFAGFYHRVAQGITPYLDKPAIFLAILMGVAGILSAFLNNDVICFAFAPVVTAATLKKRINPVPFLIALALASNIGCTLTIIGNAQNVLVGQIAKLSFSAYMGWACVPVALSIVVAYATVYFLGRKHFYLPKTATINDSEPDLSPFDCWRTIKGVGVTLIVIVLFFTPLPRYLVTLTGAGLLLCSHHLQSKKVLSGVDWQLLLLFCSLFVVAGAFHDSGLAQQGVSQLKNWGVDLGNPYWLTATSAVLSNLINNSAAVMLLVNVADFSDPINGYALALSNSFAGNLFLIGSMANIIVVQSAAERGIRISFGEFARYGVPTAVLSLGILLAWITVMR